MQGLIEENKRFKAKYTDLKSKYRQSESKLKAFLAERDKLFSEKCELQEKNHTYLQDATRLHQLTEEMKEFESKVYTKKIAQVEAQLESMGKENEMLKNKIRDLSKETKPVGENFSNNVREQPSVKVETRLERLIRENNRLVLSMQNVLDSCSSLRFPEPDPSPDPQTRELIAKLEKLTSENSLLRSQEKTSQGIITDLRERVARLENDKSAENVNHKTISELKENIKAKEAEIRSLEIKLKFYEENEPKLKTQLEILAKEREDFSTKFEALKALKNREIEVILPEPTRDIPHKEGIDIEILHKSHEKLKLELELERQLRLQYFESIKELELILRELMNEGEMFRHHVKKTLSEENRAILEKYKILLEAKPKEL